MLQSFTWQQFLVAALIFSLVWLAVVVLLFYRKEVFKLLSGSDADAGLKAEPLQHAWQDDFEPLADDDLMGRSALPDGVSVLGQDDFGFAPRDQGSSDGTGLDAAGNSVLLQADLFDLMESVKPLLEADGLTKTEFIEEVQAQVRHYPMLANSPLLGSFYQSLTEQVNDSEVLGFEVSAEEFYSVAA